jgi:hypothetical protein
LVEVLAGHDGSLFALAIAALAFFAAIKSSSHP